MYKFVILLALLSGSPIAFGQEADPVDTAGEHVYTWISDKGGTISDAKNWSYPDGTTPPTQDMWANDCATIVFSGTRKGNVVLDFTPLTLGGLIVEEGAIPSETWMNKTGYTLSNKANVTENGLGSANGGNALIRYLNIRSKDDSAVVFDLRENFTIGSSDQPFTAVNIESSWNLNLYKSDAKTVVLPLYGPMRGGKGNTIHISGGGSLILNNSNQFLEADIHLSDGSLIQFNTNSKSINSTDLLGKGTFIVDYGKLKFGGDSGALFSNNVHINAGGRFETIEQNRNGVGDTTDERSQYLHDLVVYVNMTGNISGDGDWVRASDPGKNATNETWVFLGDNSQFRGNWYTSADVHNYTDGGQYPDGKDKPYSYIPMVFGDGSAFTGSDYSAIAGTGNIIGVSSGNPRGGAIVAFNYANDVTIINNLQGELKIRHLTNAALTLSGTNTHIFGTYAENGGTIRFSSSTNLGNPDAMAATGNRKGGAIIALNNGSVLEYAATQTELDSSTGAGKVLKNGLFNSEGSWGIGVTNENVVLYWDVSCRGIYKESYNYTDPVRTGQFTKYGSGTLNITNGKLLTSANSILIRQGTLEFSGNGDWGAANRIIMGGATLRKEGGVVLVAGETLTTDQTERERMVNIIDSDLYINGGTLEFVLNDHADSYSIFNAFNDYTVTGDFLTNSQGTFHFSIHDGMGFDKEGYYLLFRAGNDLSSMDWSRFSLTGLPDPSTSRQKFVIYTGGSKWGDNGEHTVDGNSNEVYLYATPDACTLTWNLATGGMWKPSHGFDDWTGHPEDNRFYDGDTVIFQDNIAAGGKIITLGGNVNPARVTVQGTSDYTFDSERDGDNATLYGIIGQGRLDKSGSGSLTIKTSNTYSGGTLITGGRVTAAAAQSFGSGLIEIDGSDAILTTEIDNALANCDIKLYDGQIILKSTNRDQGVTSVYGGSIMVQAEFALGSSSVLNIHGGNVYAMASDSLGESVITVDGGILHAMNDHSFGKSDITVSNGGVIRTGSEEFDSALGTGTITLKDGGILELNHSSALNGLQYIAFDGGTIRAQGLIDASSFTNIHLTNNKAAIVDVSGKDSVLTLGGFLASSISAVIRKEGEGTLTGTLGNNFMASVNITNGVAHLHQGMVDGVYTSYKILGKITGTGTFKLTGGSIQVNSDLSNFDGTFMVDLDSRNEGVTLNHTDIATIHRFDMLVNKGYVALSDTSTHNLFMWGNLYSGSNAEASQSTIGVARNVITGTIENKHNIMLTQTTDGEFKGSFINGGYDGTAEVGLFKSGAATLILSNDNSSTGQLYIDTGAIQLGNGGATGYWAGDIVNDSRLSMVYGNADKAYANVISGTGSVEITTGGTVTFSGANTYSGGTSIKGGTVRLTGNGTLGTGGISLSGNSILDAGGSANLADRHVTVESGSKASIRNASLGTSGTFGTGSGLSSVTVTGGTIRLATIDTSSSAPVVTGEFTGSRILLNAAARAGDTTPILENACLGLGTQVVATGGTSRIEGVLTVAYSELSLAGNPGNMEVVDVKLALGEGGSYDITQLGRIVIDIDESFLLLLGDQTTLAIDLFSEDADPSRIISGDDPAGSVTIELNKAFGNAGWKLTDSTFTGDTAWWNSGQLHLERTIPEPSAALLFLAGCTLAFRMRRR